jgi:hypothetical protein
MTGIEHVDEDDFAPTPSRLVEGLRDTGYSLKASFADIVDNSIAADATKIDIQIYQEIDGRLRVVISDNGDGMDLPTLLNAMRYGSPKRESPKSLGKFGMGLKTASTAFCRKLTVLSKQNEALHGRTWDIDEIIRLDQWKLLTPNYDNYEEDIETLSNLSNGGSGTVIIWEEVDRLLVFSNKNAIVKAMNGIITEITDHLSSTFGKFLDKDNAEVTNVDIMVNGVLLEGWTPSGEWLNANGEKRVTIQSKNIDVEMVEDGLQRDESFELKGIILPNKSQLTEEELKQLRYGNDNQGFYIYREGRLIIGGGWPHRLFTKEPHLNLLRVELNFNHELDDYFGIDIRKTRIIFPQSLRERIKTYLAPYRNEANQRYRQGSKPVTPPGEKGGDTNDRTGSNNAIGKHTEDNTHAEVSITNPQSGEISVKNKYGETAVSHAELVKGTDVLVEERETLDDGVLWQFGINEDGEVCVLLNKSHVFYKKFYTPNFNNPVLIQSMDSLFWALANGEIGSMSEKSRRNIEELRFLVSKDLRFLAEELPDVD